MVTDLFDTSPLMVTELSKELPKPRSFDFVLQKQDQKIAACGSFYTVKGSQVDCAASSSGTSSSVSSWPGNSVITLKSVTSTAPRP